jgi:biopolymer transport protein ExbD
VIVPLPTVRKRPRIEIIPLIDIIFFLLATFVMLSLSMVKNQGINVNLPTAATAVVQDTKELVTLTITDNEQITMDKDIVTFQEMSRRLQTLKVSEPGLKVLINGDAKASWGTAIGVLDEVRHLGIDKVAIRTKNAGGAS